MTVVGSAFVEISPLVVKDFGSQIVKDIAQQMRGAAAGLSKAGESAGEDVTKGLTKGAAGKSVGEDVAKDVGQKLRGASSALTKAGEAAGGDVKRGITEANAGAAGSHIVTEVEGKLRNAKGQFVKAGEQIGSEVAKGGGPGGSKFGHEFAEKADRSAQDGMRSTLKKLGGIIAGAAIGATIFHFLKDSVVEAEDANATLRTTDALLKASQHQAGLTAKQVAAISQRLSIKIGVDDEDVQKAGNILLTFGNVGKDAFSRTLTAASDLSGVLKTSLAGSTRLLGKALEDPETGYKKLAKAGITFNAQQVEQIKTLSASGDKLGAQNVILGKIESRYGGAGAAAASASSKIKVAVKNIEEAAGGGIVKALDGITPALTGVVSSLEPVFGALGTALGPVISQIGQAVGALAPGLSALLPAVGGLFSAFGPLLTVVAQVASAIGKTLGPIIGGLTKTLAPVIAVISKDLGSALKSVEPALKIFGQVIGQSLGQIGPIFAKLIDGSFKQIRPLLPQLADAFVQLAEALLPLLPPLLQLLTPFLKLSGIIEKFQLTILLGVVKGLTLLVKILAPLAEVIAKVLGAGLSLIGDLLGKIAGVATEAAKGLGNLFGIVSTHAPKAGSYLAEMGQKAEDSVAKHEHLRGKVESVATSIERVIDPAKRAGDATKNAGDDAGKAAHGYDLFKDAADKAATMFQKFLDLANGQQETAGDASLAAIDTARQTLDLYLQTASGQVSGVESLLQRQKIILGGQKSLLPELGQLAIQSQGDYGKFTESAKKLGESLTTQVAGALGISKDKAAALVDQILKIPTKQQFTALLDDKDLKAALPKLTEPKSIKVTPAVDLADSAYQAGLKAVAAARTIGVTPTLQNTADFLNKVGNLVLAVQAATSPTFSITTPGRVGAVIRAFGGTLTEGQIDGTTSTKREVVIPLERGTQKILDVAKQTGVADVLVKALGGDRPRTPPGGTVASSAQGSSIDALLSSGSLPDSIRHSLLGISLSIKADPETAGFFRTVRDHPELRAFFSAVAQSGGLPGQAVTKPISVAGVGTQPVGSRLPSSSKASAREIWDVNAYNIAFSQWPPGATIEGLGPRPGGGLPAWLKIPTITVPSGKGTSDPGAYQSFGKGSEAGGLSKGPVALTADSKLAAYFEWLLSGKGTSDPGAYQSFGKGHETSGGLHKGKTPITAAMLTRRSSSTPPELYGYHHEWGGAFAGANFAGTPNLTGITTTIADAVASKVDDLVPATSSSSSSDSGSSAAVLEPLVRKLSADVNAMRSYLHTLATLAEHDGIPVKMPARKGELKPFLSKVSGAARAGASALDGAPA